MVPPTLAIFALFKLSVCSSHVDRMWRPSSMLSAYYDKICLKFTSHHFLLYAVYICQKSLNFIYAFKCYLQKCKLVSLLACRCLQDCMTVEQSATNI